MNGYSWMCRNSLQGLYKEGYCKGVDDFINFIFLNLKNISGDEIKCSCVMCKNKKVPLIRYCDDAGLLAQHLVLATYIKL